MQMIVARFLKTNLPLSKLPEKAVVHINDTHPALAIPELMRILMDEQGLGWDDAWDITSRMFAYTNHTIMSEALEKWPEQLFIQILPRIYSIVKEINERFCAMVYQNFPQKRADIHKMAIIGYGQIAMAPLCIAGSYSINGVSMLHSKIIREETFKDYSDVYPSKFTNVTNGVTHRRWLMLSNPMLTDLISKRIGSEWISNPESLELLKEHVNDTGLLDQFDEIKKHNKLRLAKYIKQTTGILVSEDSIFDVQVKRLHEYKRQLMKC
jgi:starch phosphorylase